MTFEIHVQWRTALASEGGEPYYYPEKFTPFFREKYAEPGVYRWRVIRNQPGEKEPIYIGEAEELPRRIQRVRTPSRKAEKNDTNKRLHEIFHRYITEGRKIVVDIADVEPFETNSVRFGRATLGDRFKRRAMENIILALAQKSQEFESLECRCRPGRQGAAGT